MGAYLKLGDRGIKGLFWGKYELHTSGLWAPSVANMYKSDQASETFRFLGPVGTMQEWKGKGREKKQLAAYELKIRHVKSELTVEFDIDDMDREQTGGQIQNRISTMGIRAATLPEKGITQVMITPGNSYDGIAFYGDHMAGNATRINNDIADTTIVDPLAPTTTDMLRNIMNAIARINGSTDQAGEPLNDAVSDFAVVFPSLYQGPIAGALGDTFTTAGTSNTLRALIEGNSGRRLTILPLVNPRLPVPVTTGVFYVVALGTPEKPFIWQDEVHDGQVTKFDSLLEGSDTTFMTDKVLYGVKRKGAAIPGEHSAVVRVTVS